jgi:flagellar basal-body rod modification protein FlgD
MHKVSANYTMPTVLNTLKSNGSSAVAKTATAKAAASSSSSSSSAGGLSSTFLSLLAQELQNQDPTAPVDPTAMVGQMISLNQLEQLISINQGITGTSTTDTTTQATQAAGAAASDVAVNVASSGVQSMLSPSAAGAATTQLPFDPNTMMPLAYGNAGAVDSSINSSINAAMLGFSGTNNNTSGGK